MKTTLEMTAPQSTFSQGKKEPIKLWLHYLTETENAHPNLENVETLQSISPNTTLHYVQRTLEILDTLDIPENMVAIIKNVLQWSEVAKGGSKTQRVDWTTRGHNLMAHNEGSASIFREHVEQLFPMDEKTTLVYELIKTHGLIGQYLRGESELKSNQRMIETILSQFSKAEAKTLLRALNHCIIGGVSPILWDSVKVKVSTIITQLLNLDYTEDFQERLLRMRTLSNDDSTDIEKVENFARMKEFLSGKELWYVEPSLKEFTFNEFWTLFELVQERLGSTHIQHIYFGKLMEQLYYDYKDKKRINVYRKRIIEKFLKDLKNGLLNANPHVSLNVEIDAYNDMAYVSFAFSDIGEALINFCVEAEKVDMMHTKASIMLYDFFELRRDDYDRFNNEESYLSDMSSSADDKRVILDYLKGDSVLDIGPGSGVMLDMIEKEADMETVVGVDLSTNVIEELKTKKKNENHTWDVVKGDALKLHESFAPNTFDTVLFSSIIHELFSYVPYQGKKFNYDVIAATLESAYDILKPGGRIIIRDGVMTEEAEERRLIRFKNEEDMKWLLAYTSQFKGRHISYHAISKNEVIMPVNDALEFLYTYTWGEEAFAHEVNEQFAYFTPMGYMDFIWKTFGSRMKFVYMDHYLQKGYTDNLSEKIDFEDLEGNPEVLPDSTCLLVLEKQ